MIDEKPVSEPMTRLTPGPHAVGVSAPRFNFYSDTIVVRPGEIAEVSPQLTPIGSPDLPRRRTVTRAAGRCEPGPGYNADGSCFDERPKPATPPFVPVPDEVTETPRPSLLWVKVSTEGRTVDVGRLRPSDDPAFERAVRNFVWSRDLASRGQGRGAGRSLDPDAVPARAQVSPRDPPIRLHSPRRGRDGRRHDRPGCERLVRRGSSRRHGPDRDRLRMNLQDGTIVHVDEDEP